MPAAVSTATRRARAGAPAHLNLVASRPDGITRGELLDLVYADEPNDGPDNPNTISVLIKHANEELAAQGFCIEPAWLGPGARYRLVRVAP